MSNFCGTSRLFPAPYDYMETQIGSCRRQSASLLLLRINHMLITAQSNGVNFPTNLRYNIHHSDLRIMRQTELLLQIVPDSLRFLTAIWKQVNRETAGDRRRQSQTVAGTLTIIWKPGLTALVTPKGRRLY